MSSNSDWLTPATLVNRPFSEIFHDPADSRPCRRKLGHAKTRRENPYFQMLGDLMAECSDAQPGGCENCARQKGCKRWWGGVAEEANHDHILMTRGLFNQRKREFETRIKPR
jgi:hypothetical protein